MYFSQFLINSGLTTKGVNYVMLPYSAVFKLVPDVFGQQDTHAKN